MQVFEHLLSDTLKHRGANLASVVPAYGRIEDDGDGDDWIVDRRETGKRSNVLGPRISVGGGINLLRRTRLAAGAVAFKNRLLAGSVQHHTLHHLFHLGGGQPGDDLTALGGVESNHLRCTLGRRRPGDDAGRHPLAVVGDGRNHACQLQGGDADFLSHGDCANRYFRPAVERLGQAASLARELNTGLLTESVATDVLVEALVAEAQSDLDSAHVTGVRQDVGNGQHAEGFPVVNAAATDDDRAHLTIEDFVGPGEMLVKRGRNGHQLECGTGFVDIADGMILEPLGGDFPGDVGIECGAVGQRQDFAGVRIFHDYRARLGAALLHRGFQFALGDVLDLLIDSQNDVLAGIRLFFHAAEPLLAGVDLDKLLPGLPRSRSSYSRSIPLRPSSSVPTYPRTWAARSRLG